MMYGMTPFGRNAFDLFNLWNDIDNNYDSMPVNACKTDIKDTGDKYVMESELPGFEKEDIKLDINGEFLVISAEHSAEKEEKGPVQRVFLFASLDEAIHAAKAAADGYTGESSLYKNPEDSKYYLLLRDKAEGEAFARTVNLLSEFSRPVKNRAPGTDAYYEEHFDVILGEDALRKLAKI